MKYILICLMFFSSLVFANEEKKHFFVVSGVVVASDSSKKIEHFVQGIEKRSGYPLKVLYVNSYDKLSKVLRNNPDALGWTCGAPYVQDHIKDGQQLIAIPLYNSLPTYSSFIVTRKSEKATKLSDFASKIFVYSDLRSNSGYVAPSSVLQKEGIDMENFFKLKILAGTHEKSIDAIYRGLADVGAIDEYVWVLYTKSRPYLKEKLHVIQKSGPYAFTPIVAGKDVSTEMVEKLQNALVNMNKDELKRFKDDFDLDGFVKKDNAFFDGIKDNMTKIGMDLNK